ncbi:MAG TPA: hypothetical protein VIO94_06520 [Phenylobacterium sp.]
MRTADYAKAAGLALLLLALNLALTFVVVFLYAQFLERGHEQAFYTAAAPGIAAWSAPIGGALLFLAAGWILARRSPGRNGVAFIFVAWLFYVLIDGGMGVAAMGLAKTATLQLAVSFSAALAGGLIGAVLGRPRPQAAGALAA